MPCRHTRDRQLQQEAHGCGEHQERSGFAVDIMRRRVRLPMLAVAVVLLALAPLSLAVGEPPELKLPAEPGGPELKLPEPGGPKLKLPEPGGPKL
jgi:hypothetical protein